MEPIEPWPKPTYMPRVEIIVTRMAALELMTFIDLDEPNSPGRAIKDVTGFEMETTEGGQLRARLKYGEPSSPRPTYRPEWVRVTGFGFATEPWGQRNGLYAMGQDMIDTFAKYDARFLTKEGRNAE